MALSAVLLCHGIAMTRLRIGISKAFLPGTSGARPPEHRSATRLRPRLPWVVHARAPRGARRCAAGTGRAGWGRGGPLGVPRGESLGKGGCGKAGGTDFKRNCQRPEVSCTQETHRRYTHVAPETTRDVRDMRRPTKRFLASTGGGNGRWDGGQLVMTQEARDHRLLGSMCPC